MLFFNVNHKIKMNASNNRNSPPKEYSSRKIIDWSKNQANREESPISIFGLEKPK